MTTTEIRAEIAYWTAVRDAAEFSHTEQNARDHIADLEDDLAAQEEIA